MSILKSICLMPFISLGTKPDGTARVCCMAPSLEAKKDGNLVSVAGSSLEETWNGETFRDVRKRMLAGERLPECSFCWKEEAAGKRSKRIKENSKFKHHLNRILTCNDGYLAQKPVHLDLRLGNVCNLRCRTCNPMFSSAIAAELRHHEKEWQSDNDFNEQYIHAYRRAYKSNEWSDDLIFWNNIDQLAETAEEIYISGGEPTLVPKLTDFLERCVDSKNVNARIRLNSNMTRLPNRMIEALSHFKQVDWGASVDGIGLRNDWMRFPSKFDEIEANICELVEKGPPFYVEINCTVSLYNVFALPELFSWSRKIGVDLITDILHNPVYMQLEHLPDDLKDQTVENLTNLLELDAMKDNERHGIIYVINSLKKTRNSKLWDTAIRHALMLDKWQGKNIALACPEFARYLI